MIRTESLTFRYAHSHEDVLKKISLQIGKGEFVAIIGASGSGKSTLCLTFNGIIPHSIRGDFSGKVVVCGMETHLFPVYDLSEKVGIILQNPESQLFAMSVEEELAFGPENLAIPRAEIERRIEEVLRTVRIQDRNAFPGALSGGEKQRVAIAALLTLKPDILVLDEPTSQLDPHGKLEIYSLLSELNRQGMTIVVVEHETEYLAEFAQKVALIDQGSLVGFDRKEKILKDTGLLSLIGVRIPDIVEFTARLKERGYLPTICLNEAEVPALRIEVKTGFKRRHAPQREEMVRFQNVTFRYPESEHIALKDVTLSIGKSERVAIVGENGSGKTTLVKHVNNLLRPTGGEVFVNGEDIKGKTTAQMAHRVGFVFQNPEHQIFADTVFEEVAFGLRNLGLDESEIITRVESVLSRTRLAKYKETHPFFLSGGEKQRLALASVLVCEPDILILDEPTTGLDLKSAREIVDLVMKLNAEGKTIILVTHDMKLVGEIAERIIVMKEGVIAADGTPEEIFSDDEFLKRCYLEKPPVTRLAEKMGLGICLTVKEALERIK